MKAGLNAMFGNRVVYRPRMGDLLAASFTVPQNPIRSALVKGMGGLGCSGGCGGGMSGVFDDPQGWLTETNPTMMNLPNWVVYGGIAAVAYMVLGGKKGRR